MKLNHKFEGEDEGWAITTDAENPIYIGLINFLQYQTDKGFHSYKLCFMAKTIDGDDIPFVQDKELTDAISGKLAEIEAELEKKNKDEADAEWMAHNNPGNLEDWN